MRRVATLLLLVACPASTMPEFEAARAAALAPPPPVAKDWRPDAVLHLSAPLMHDVVAGVLQVHGQWSRDDIDVLGGVGKLSPTVVVREVTLTATDRCEACLQVDVALDGELGFKVGPVPGRLPLVVDASLDVAVRGGEDAGVWRVIVDPGEVRSVRVRPRDRQLPRSLEDRANAAVTAWVQRELDARLADVEVAAFDPVDVPLRALRVAPSELGLRIDLLTAASTPTALPEVQAKIPDGWKLTVQQDSLLDLARRAAFEAGPGVWDIVSEPTSLDFGRDGFSLGLRLWMASGTGWWRDYTVHGTVESKAGKQLVLSATGVEEGAVSPGAAMVDPLAALGSSSILASIESCVAGVFPTRQSSTMKGLQVTGSVRSISGAGGQLVVRGDLTVGTAEPAARPATGRPRPKR